MGQESNLDLQTFTPDIDNGLQEEGGGADRDRQVRMEAGVIEEEGSSGEEGGASPDKVVKPEGGKADDVDSVEVVDRVVNNVDEEYVHALELYCLLKQRLLDVRHNWSAVVKEALSDHGKYTGRRL